MSASCNCFDHPVFIFQNHSSCSCISISYTILSLSKVENMNVTSELVQLAIASVQKRIAPGLIKISSRTGQSYYHSPDLDRHESTSLSENTMTSDVSVSDVVIRSSTRYPQVHTPYFIVVSSYSTGYVCLIWRYVLVCTPGVCIDSLWILRLFGWWDEIHAVWEWYWFGEGWREYGVIFSMEKNAAWKITGRQHITIWESSKCDNLKFSDQYSHLDLPFLLC